MGREFNSFHKLLKKHGVSQGCKRYGVQWWKENKWVFWVVIILVILGIAPVWPSSVTDTVRLDIPVGSDTLFSPTAIPVVESCDGFQFPYPGSYQPQPALLRTAQSPYNIAPSKGAYQPVEYNYSEYSIGIYAIQSCTCIDASQLAVSQEKTCMMNRSSVMGYFKRCSQKRDQYGYASTVCERIPFVSNSEVAVVAPNHEFKLRMEPFITTEKTRDSDNDRIYSRYAVDLHITHPEWTGVPYIKWIATAFLFILDPLKSLLRYFMDNWFYK